MSNNNQQPIGAEEYYQLLLRLLKEGTGFGKSGEIAVLPLNDGIHAVVTKDLAQGREIQKKGVQDMDIDAPGTLLKKMRYISQNYLRTDDQLYWKPDPEAFRIGIKLSEATILPVQWDKAGLKVPAGGMVFLLQKHVRELSDVLQSLKDGKAKAEDALFATNNMGEKVARFDIYGTEPSGLHTLGLDQVPLSNGTKWVSLQFGGVAPKKPSFIVYPEPATFRKKLRTPAPPI